MQEECRKQCPGPGSVIKSLLQIFQPWVYRRTTGEFKRCEKGEQETNLRDISQEARIEKMFVV